MRAMTKKQANEFSQRFANNLMRKHKELRKEFTHQQITLMWLEYRSIAMMGISWSLWEVIDEFRKCAKVNSSSESLVNVVRLFRDYFYEIHKTYQRLEKRSGFEDNYLPTKHLN